MTEFISMPIPAELYRTVVRLIDDYLSDAGAPLHPNDETWRDLADADPHGMGPSWWSELRPDERRLFRTFVGQSRDELEAAALAEAMGIGPGDLAGILGPFQRRTSRGPFPPALVSRTASVNGRRVKVLTLAEGLREVLGRIDDAGAPSPETKVRSTGRRDK